MRTYLPHYLKNRPSTFHEELTADLNDLSTHRGRHVNRIAPRGGAKTTFCSKAYSVYSVCEGLEGFILLLSDGADQAASILESVKAELENNPAIERDYPHAFGPGKVWQVERAVSRNGVLMVAKGAGGKMRGLTKRESRPTLVIIDDANSDDEGFSERKRERKWSWLTKGVLPIGEPGTNFVSVGTAIHAEAIPCRLAVDGGWQTKSYRSIIDWPTRMDLWVEWEKLYTNLADTDRGATARRFYEANRTDMDAGSRVLWQDRFPLYDLMCRRATGGEAAFNCEYQDTPGTDGATEWPESYFNSEGFWVPKLPSDFIFSVQALDPSKGSTDRPSDFQAHCFCGLGQDGNLYFDADLRREDSTRMCERAAELIGFWKPHVLVVEVNSGMGLIEAEFRDLDSRGMLFGRDVESVTSTDAKSSRIRRIGAYLARGQVRVVGSVGGRMLVDQLKGWPNHKYDDGPDGAGMCLQRVELAMGVRE